MYFWYTNTRRSSALVAGEFGECVLHIVHELLAGCVAGAWQRPNDNVTASGDSSRKVMAHMPKPSVGSVSDDRITDGFGNDETEVRSAETDKLTLIRDHKMDDNRFGSRPASLTHYAPELGRVQLELLREHSCKLRGQLCTALATTSRNDCATGTGTHTSTEAVNTCTTTVVRLERPLALCHGYTPKVLIGRRHGCEKLAGALNDASCSKSVALTSPWFG